FRKGPRVHPSLLTGNKRTIVAAPRRSMVIVMRRILLRVGLEKRNKSREIACAAGHRRYAGLPLDFRGHEYGETSDRSSQAARVASGGGASPGCDLFAALRGGGWSFGTSGQRRSRSPVEPGEQPVWRNCLPGQREAQQRAGDQSVSHDCGRSRESG